MLNLKDIRYADTLNLLAILEFQHAPQSIFEGMITICQALNYNLSSNWYPYMLQLAPIFISTKKKKKIVLQLAKVFNFPLFCSWAFIHGQAMGRIVPY